MKRDFFLVTSSLLQSLKALHLKTMRIILRHMVILLVLNKRNTKRVGCSIMEVLFPLPDAQEIGEGMSNKRCGVLRFVR
jgi:hypothetical protein